MQWLSNCSKIFSLFIIFKTFGLGVLVVIMLIIQNNLFYSQLWHILVFNEFICHFDKKCQIWKKTFYFYLNDVAHIFGLCDKSSCRSFNCLQLWHLNFFDRSFSIFGNCNKPFLVLKDYFFTFPDLKFSANYFFFFF